MLSARGCLRLFLLVLGCPICLNVFQVDSIVVGGCRLQQSCFVFGLLCCRSLCVVVRCFGRFNFVSACFVFWFPLLWVVLDCFRLFWNRLRC